MHVSTKEHDVESMGSNIMASGGADVTYIRSYLATPIQTGLNTLDPHGRRKESRRLS